ncbi:MAG: TetR/AcrR family transcriptional regulator [Pseudomonadota bacterium]
MRLLVAAEELLASAGDLTLRQVALRAGVTPPLAHYYFGNREGLVAALVEERAGSRIDELLAAAQKHVAQPLVALTRLMQRLTLLAAHDGFLRRCLLLPAGDTLRVRLRAGLDQLLQEAQATGQLRTDLTAGYLAEALLGLCLFPFIDATSDQDGERAAVLTLRHVALLQDGILSRRRQDTGVIRGK